MALPNILVILTDDQRYNTIHALGNQTIQTPNLDRLVRRGTSFTNAHIPGGTVGAICMPSRAMLNTGRTLFHLEENGQTVPKEHTLLGEHLKEHGYECFGTGKWHNSPAAFTRAFSNGENIFFGGMWDHWNVPVCNYDITGQYDNVIDFVCDFYHSNQTTPINCDKFHPGVHSSTLLTDTAVKFVEEYAGHKPFFLYTAYLAPHDPRTMPEKYRSLYNPDDIELPANFTENPLEFGVQNIRDEVLAAYPRDPAEIRRHIAEYYGMITHLDAEIGRLLDSLEKKGVLENTIIVFAGDNGLAVGCHGLMGKQNHFEHSIRVPLILAGPGIPEGETRGQFVYLLDVYPTLCELLHLPIPTSVEGISFARMLSEPAYTTRETLYFAYANLIRSIKKGDWKLIEYCTEIRKTQLFNLREDPDECVDLYPDQKDSDVVGRLREEMFAIRDAWEDRSHPLGEEFWRNYE